MPTMHFIEADGTRHEVEVPQGQSAMQAAVDQGLSGMVGECCGSMACATCHCFVAEDWLERVGGEAADMELDMLGCSPVEVQNTSRLACQIFASDELDGIEISLPESQF